VEKKLASLEVEDEEFRQKIEKLREHAGESWLTVYNEMQDDNEQKVQNIELLLDYELYIINNKRRSNMLTSLL